ncbi:MULTISPECIES: ABC transporter permease [Rhodococcus]|uniref:ABC transporter permease n=1 Tax=Rhodococcus pseudokoreensis TaxID=2811421 RepID=A0A974WE33_9NOCA|nr:MULTISPECIES: ABC transporter permease [Rhodococcus]MBV6756368.1 ABC transporter permease [Rhodococcus opacus]QSE94863.1 ABC transporter permease [Rhodococcus pseudokoreensis]
MGRYIASRIGQAFLVLWAAYTASFVLLAVLPSDPISIRISAPDSGLTPEDGERLREYYGLDQPIVAQYVHRLAGVLHGDFGYSLTRGTPVRTLIAEALPSTIHLTAFSLLAGLLIAGVLGVAASYSRFGWLRGLLLSVPPLFASVPTFLIGILFLQVFSFELGWLPAVADGSASALVAPVLTLGIAVSAPLAQVLIRTLDSIRREPFVQVVLAKGADDGYAFRHHVLRNSILPWLTLLGLTIGELIAGSLVTETVYSRDGIGRLTQSSVQAQDLPVIQAVVLLAASVYVLVNLVIDLVYPLVDPRIQLIGGRSRIRAHKVKEAA